MKTRLFQWVMAAALMCGTMLFTSCKDNNEGGGDGSAAGIAMIVKNGNIDYFRQIETSFRSVCREKGLTPYYYATTTEMAYEEQVAAVKELRKLGSDALKGIIISPSYGPNGESAEAEVAALAKERNIPVVVIDSPVSAQSPLASYPYFGTDNAAAGRAMAELVAGDEVAVFAMRNSPGVERANAFKALKPGADIILVDDDATEEVQAVIDDYADFVFFNGNDLVGALDILRTGGTRVYTFDVYGEFLDELIQGNSFLKGIMAQNTFAMARKAVEAIVTNAKQGEAVPTFFITPYNLDDANVKPFMEFYGKQVPAIEDLATKLQGKWAIAESEGEPVMTYDINVVTFLSATKATISYSKTDFAETNQRKWSNRREYDVVISGNKLAMTGHPNETITLLDEMVIHSITANEILCRYKHTTYRNGEELVFYENEVKMVKVTMDYTNAIVGTWEGYFGKGETPQLWRWEFKADGTYVFSMKSGDGAWKIFEDEFSEYFVDGPLLCVRWQNVGEGQEENREWWEIKGISGNKMRWSVYDQDEGGEPFTQDVELTKVN